MKKLILFLFLTGIFAAGTSQNVSQRFFRPVDNNLFKTGVKAVNPSVWLFRPTVAVTAIQLTYNKDSKGFDASALNSAGFGVGYQHFVEVNGLPYNNYGFNGLLLLGADVENIEPATVSLALTGSFFTYINVGAIYNFTNKKVGILTGVTFKF